MHDHKHYFINPNSQHHPIRLSNHSIPVPVTLALPIHRNPLHTINPPQSIQCNLLPSIHSNTSTNDRSLQSTPCKLTLTTYTRTLKQLSVLIWSLMNALLLINIPIQRAIIAYAIFHLTVWLYVYVMSVSLQGVDCSDWSLVDVFEWMDGGDR